VTVKRAQTSGVVGSTMKAPARSSKACRSIAGVGCQEQVMSINKDQIKGRVKEAEGKVKEVTGALLGNASMEEKGKLQKNRGKAQAKFGDVKHDVKDAAKPM
jgi:uncharacterized protein YjbJ (UPF0337 family)